MRFSMYRRLIAIVILAGLLGYSVIQAGKEESSIEEYTRLNNELASTYQELILHVKDNPTSLYGPNCFDNYGEEKCKKLYKSIANAKFQQIRYESLTQIKSKGK